MNNKITIVDLQRMCDRGERIAMLTAYDYTSARIADEAGVSVLLVGDTLGMVVLGYDSTLPVTLDDMIRHGRAAARGAKRAHVVVDLPFGTYQSGWQDALANAVRLMQLTGCGSVKLEGGRRSCRTVSRLVEAGIPVMGHIGLTPQSVNALGGWRVQGKSVPQATALLNDAEALERAGAYAIVLELVPAALAQLISDRLHIPTIGIGAGAGCDGQVQVWHDVLGLYDDMKPKHARRFVEGGEVFRAAIVAYRNEVEAGAFPSEKESFRMDAEAIRTLSEACG